MNLFINLLTAPIVSLSSSPFFEANMVATKREISTTKPNPSPEKAVFVRVHLYFHQTSVLKSPLCTEKVTDKDLLMYFLYIENSRT